MTIFAGFLAICRIGWKDTISSVVTVKKVLRTIILIDGQNFSILFFFVVFWVN